MNPLIRRLGTLLLFACATVAAQDTVPDPGSPGLDAAVKRWEGVVERRDPAETRKFLDGDRRFAWRIANREIDLFIQGKMVGLTSTLEPAEMLIQALEGRAEDSEFEKRQAPSLRGRLKMARSISQAQAQERFLALAAVAEERKLYKAEASGDILSGLEKSLKTLEDLGDQTGIVDVLEALAGAQRFARQPKESMATYDRMAKLAQQIGDRLRFGRALGRAGELLKSEGAYQDSNKLFDAALAIARAERDPEEEVEALNSLASLGSELRRFQEAVKYHQATLKVLEKWPNRPLEARTHVNLGSVYEKLQQPDEALACYATAKRLIGDDPLSPLLASIENNTGTILGTAGKWDEAVQHWEEGLRLHRKALNWRGELSSLDNLAMTYFKIGREGSVIVKTYEDALRLAHEAGEHELEVRLLGGLGYLLAWDPERVAEGVAKLEQAIKLTEGMRTSIGMLEQDKRAWFASHRMIYEMAVWALFRAKRSEDAFLMLERMRARNLQDAIQFRDAGLKDVPPELLEKRSAVFTEINGRRKERRGLYQSLVTAKDEAGRAAVQLQLAKRDEQLAALETSLAELERGIQLRQRIEETTLASFAEVQQSLAKDEGLVLYTAMTMYQADWKTREMRKAPVTVACLVTRETIDFAPLPRDETTADLIARLRRGAIASGRGYPVAAFKERALKLYEILIQPAEPRLRGVGLKRLTIVPDETLYSIPFEALVCSDKGEDYASLDYLGRRFDIDYVYSATLLVRRRQMKREGPVATGFVGFGDPDYGGIAPAGKERGRAGGGSDPEFGAFEPERGGEDWPRLPQSGVEVEKISELFKDRRRVFQRKEASEGAARKAGLAEGARVLHFACHGSVQRDDPMKSALVLASDEGNDGFLEAREIADLRFPVELVVMSACDSGTGEMLPGEGLIGLTRALMMAGAESVLSSLWTVADEGGREFMVRFYTQWTGGKERVAALADVKRQLMGHARYSAPYYWAGFVLHGP